MSNEKELPVRRWETWLPGPPMTIAEEQKAERQENVARARHLQNLQREEKKRHADD